MTRALLAILLCIGSAGCAAYWHDQTQGTSGPLTWYVIDATSEAAREPTLATYTFTLVVQQTEGVPITFTTMTATVYSGTATHAPEMLWEWEKQYIARLLWNATTFGRELAHRYFSNWNALAEENQRIWETYYLPRPLYQPWDSWQGWMAEYREIVRDVQNIYEEHHGRRGKDPILSTSIGQ